MHHFSKKSILALLSLCLVCAMVQAAPVGSNNPKDFSTIKGLASNQLEKTRLFMTECSKLHGWLSPVELLLMGTEKHEKLHQGQKVKRQDAAASDTASDTFKNSTTLTTTASLTSTSSSFITSISTPTSELSSLTETASSSVSVESSSSSEKVTTTTSSGTVSSTVVSTSTINTESSSSSETSTETTTETATETSTEASSTDTSSTEASSTETSLTDTSSTEAPSTEASSTETSTQTSSTEAAATSSSSSSSEASLSAEPATTSLFSSTSVETVRNQHTTAVYTHVTLVLVTVTPSRKPAESTAKASSSSVTHSGVPELQTQHSNSESNAAGSVALQANPFSNGMTASLAMLGLVLSTLVVV